MKRTTLARTLLLAGGMMLSIPASAEILALMNYESMPPETTKALKLGGGNERREGIAIIDVDPESPAYGNILWDMPTNPEWVAHHLLYSPDQKKLYATYLAKSVLGVMDMTTNPYRMKYVDLPDCRIAEDTVFSENGKTWYVTCMGSDRVIVGDTATDKVTGVIMTKHRYPHGMDVRDDLGLALVTSTINGETGTDPGEHLDVIDTRSNKVIDSVRVSSKPSPANEAPVEVLFVPGSQPAVAYVTNMNGNTLWTATWNKKEKRFDAREVYDFAPEDAAVPLEMYFDENNTTLYVTTAHPGKLHVFDIRENAGSPKHVKTIATGGGAHHVAFDKTGRYIFVQNSFINLPGMHEGTVTVIDRKTLAVVSQMSTLKDRGLTPNSIVLIPEQNFLAGH